MSIKRLMRDYMTVQSAENAGQSTMGAIDRADSWHTLIEFANVRCNIQEKSKDTVTERFSKTEEEGVVLFYHQKKSLYDYEPADDKNQTPLRVIVNKDKSNQQLSFPISDVNDIEVYDFLGHIEQIKSSRGIKFYILRARKTDKWQL